MSESPRTAILAKGDEFSTFTQFQNIVCKFHPRTGVAQFEYESQAQAAFKLDAALTQSAFTGWQPIYVGPILRG